MPSRLRKAGRSARLRNGGAAGHQNEPLGPRNHSQWNLNADEDGEDFRMSTQKGFENPILEEDEADLETQE